MSLDMISNIIGIVGVSMVVFAYFMTQIQKWIATELRYLLCNLFGSILIVFSLVFHWNLSSFVIETFWILISIYGLVKQTAHKQYQSN